MLLYNSRFRFFARKLLSWLAAVEQEIFKFQGMVERGLSANHSMITDFIRENKLEARNVGEALFKLQERIEHLLAQFFDLQSQSVSMN